MNQLFDHLEIMARRQPRATALTGAHATVSYGELYPRLERLAGELRQRRVRVVGLLADNSPAWAIADLAAMLAGVCVVPLPAFFSDRQLIHSARDAGIDLLLIDDPGRVERLAGAINLQSAGELSSWLAYVVQRDCPPSIPAGTAKITYTSGTTGEPKGVCLSAGAMERVTLSLLERVGPGSVSRHLSVLPLATLLENIGGLYLPLLAGGECRLPASTELGVMGATGLNAGRLVSALQRHRATSAILIPQMLQALVEQEAALPDARFLAIGGAPVSRRLLDQAAARGLPVFEGYGLSECASVVCVNSPDDSRPGSVGRPLRHVGLRFGEDGEIFVRGAVQLGYLREQTSAAADDWWPTGDLGHLDPDGFLHLTGRKKNMFITSFGRNVAPEWIERELVIEGDITQAAVFGEGRPINVSVVVPRPGSDPADVAVAIRSANRRLPDYARVSAWVIADSAFTVGNGQLTATGRPRRQDILRAYHSRLERLFETNHSLEPCV